ncbi:hypothetical protein NQZ68_027270 [Dissostichus eleginoides]|nr:hypothetical protein NQZ68_027270 [Dissostichus eleginoides]
MLPNGSNREYPLLGVSSPYYAPGCGTALLIETLPSLCSSPAPRSDSSREARILAQTQVVGFIGATVARGKAWA